MQGKSKVLGAISALVVVIVAVLYMAGSFSDKQPAGLKEMPVTQYQGEKQQREAAHLKCALLTAIRTHSSQKEPSPTPLHRSSFTQLMGCQ